MAVVAIGPIFGFIRFGLSVVLHVPEVGRRLNAIGVAAAISFSRLIRRYDCSVWARSPRVAVRVGLRRVLTHGQHPIWIWTMPGWT